MTTQHRTISALRPWLAFLAVVIPALSVAQVPVDESGSPIGEYSTERVDPQLGVEDIPLLSASELEELVGPIALYPDDLLAIVLPASTYPLQVVQAGRFLEDLRNDPSLEPDETWDESVVALTNYPEVVELLNADLDWTWQLGEAVVAQQADVIGAVETFRDRAYAAGNLKSDAHQTVSRSEGIIEIVPMEEDVIYVPYYEPERVIVHQSRPVYYYYPQSYPVYYYPYPSSYAFDRRFFWGVTTAFSIGWYTDRLHVFHHSYSGHPYYGRYYRDQWWYRRPSIQIYNTTYVNNRSQRSRDYYRSGDYWQSRQHRRLRSEDRRITRNRYYPGDTPRATQSSASYARTPTYSNKTTTRQRDATRPERNSVRSSLNATDKIRRTTSKTGTLSSPEHRQSTLSSDSRRRDSARPQTRPDVKFRDRPARPEAPTRSAATVARQSLSKPASKLERPRPTTVPETRTHQARRPEPVRAAAVRPNRPAEKPRLERTRRATAPETRTYQSRRPEPARPAAVRQNRSAEKPSSAPAQRSYSSQRDTKAATTGQSRSKEPRATRSQRESRQSQRR